MRPRMCSSIPSNSRQLARGSSPSRARRSFSTVAIAFSCGTHATPSAGEKPPPSQSALAPACHLLSLANSRLAPLGPTSLNQSRSARTARADPTTVSSGSSVYISISKRRACDPYWSLPRPFRACSHCCTDSGSRASCSFSDSSKRIEKSCTSAFARRCAICDEAVKPIAITFSVSTLMSSPAPPSSAAGTREQFFHSSLFEYAN
eukprot:6378925-Prymnesium_polylepis.2